MKTFISEMWFPIIEFCVFLFVLCVFFLSVRSMLQARKQNKSWFIINALFVVVTAGMAISTLLEMYYQIVILPTQSMPQGTVQVVKGSIYPGGETGPVLQTVFDLNSLDTRNIRFISPGKLLDDNRLYLIKLWLDGFLLPLSGIGCVACARYVGNEDVNGRTWFACIVLGGIFVIVFMLLFGWQLMLMFVLLILGIFWCIKSIRIMLRERKVQIGKLYSCLLSCLIAVSMMIGFVLVGHFYFSVCPAERGMSRDVPEAVAHISWEDGNCFAVEDFKAYEAKSYSEYVCVKTDDIWFKVKVIPNYAEKEWAIEDVNSYFSDYPYEPGKQLFLKSYADIQYTYSAAPVLMDYELNTFQRSYAFLLNDTCVLVMEYSQSKQRLFEEWLLAQAAEIAE